MRKLALHGRCEESWYGERYDHCNFIHVGNIISGHFPKLECFEWKVNYYRKECKPFTERQYNLIPIGRCKFCTTVCANILRLNPQLKRISLIKYVVEMDLIEILTSLRNVEILDI